MQMRPLEMIVPSWRDFPGRVVRLAAAALIVSTALSIPRANVSEAPAPAEGKAPATATAR